MRQSKDHKFIPMTSITGGRETLVKPDIYFHTSQIVNVIFLGEPGRNWVLVDAGMPGSGDEIIKAAEEHYGKENPPQAIILTHGHFDHVGAIVDLIEYWKVPVYAHPLEFPYLNGNENYPEPDSSVEGGMLAKMSFVYPHKSTDISVALRELPSDQKVPHLPEWKWIHTPGHTPGHISLFREKDRSMISADAFITVRQDSFYNVLMQKKEINGPPVYLTTDWNAAWESVRKLQSLNPEVVIPGHGPAMEGDELREGLSDLVEHFQDKAIPDHGKYVDDDKK